jgi:kynureninase
MNFQNSKEQASLLDKKDPLNSCRDLFFYPDLKGKKNTIYLCGNSLGLQPKSVKHFIEKELELWSKNAVLGQHKRWEKYHEDLAYPTSKLVGAKPSEVVIMNALTVNLHLLLVSFYNPTKKRNKILIEKGAFPSDQYAIESQIKFHGYEPKDCLVEIEPRKGEFCLRTKDILQKIKELGSEIETILIGGVNYYTGQLMDMQSITKKGKSVGAKVGFDLAHAIGNVDLYLSKWNVDFAVWCSYKYLCAGPGAPGGAFINELYHDWDGTRFEGWWGHNKETRFKMDSKFDGIKTAEGWQLSNASILGMAPLKASMEIYENVGIESVREKSIKLSSYLDYLLAKNIPEISVMTPKNIEERGCQLSLVIENGRFIFDSISKKGIICDWREPDVIRITPHPLFNTYTEIFNFTHILKDSINAK